jgi:hypothetical protein
MKPGWAAALLGVLIVLCGLYLSIGGAYLV